MLPIHTPALRLKDSEAARSPDRSRGLMIVAGARRGGEAP
jgi:hypothetical protein